MPPEIGIQWYGERGVVNTIVAGLHRHGVPAVKEFLNAVQWADAAEKPWISSVDRVSLIVEMGLNDFGAPDLLVVCSHGEELPNAVFLEAKVVPYMVSAMPLNDGMRRGFNSSINGQLTLKFRFTQALGAWAGVPRRLAEPESVYRSYRASPGHGGLSDPVRLPRHLEKLEVLQILQRNKLVGLSLDRFHFVALTRDRQPFFADAGFAQSDFRPLLLEGGDEVWEKRCGNVGWIGFDTITEHQGLERCFGSDYTAAVATMIAREETAATAAGVTRSVSLCRDLNRFRAPIKSQLEQIVALAVDRFGKTRVERTKGGSVSIILRSKVLVKLVPQSSEGDQHLLLGISTDLKTQRWGGLDFTCVRLIGMGRNRKPFHVHRLPTGTEGVQIADAVFGEIAELLGFDREAE
jgi:hypothetical protein